MGSNDQFFESSGKGFDEFRESVRDNITRMEQRGIAIWMDGSWENQELVVNGDEYGPMEGIAVLIAGRLLRNPAMALIVAELVRPGPGGDFFVDKK